MTLDESHTDIKIPRIKDTKVEEQIDLLLIYPPYEVKFYQPIGLPQLAAYILAKGYKVRILDAVILGLDPGQVCSRIRQINPHIIGISIPFSEMIKSGIEMLKLCKGEFPNTLLICGGYHPRIRPQDVLDFCDLVVIGEGEITTSEIIERHLSGQNINDIKGTAYRKDTEIVFNELREPLQDINLPFPAWHLIPIEKYKLTLYLSTREIAFPLQTEYGCPFACTFCCNSKFHERVRYKDVDHVINEMKHVVERFGVRGFHIWDETFGLKQERAKEFCESIIRENLNIHWSAQTRPNLLDRELLELMKRAGCVRLSIGVEAGSPYVLERINKKIDLDDAIQAVSLIKDVGIVSYAGFMIGHPDDNLETVSQTISFASKLNPDFVGFRCAIPYPGCVFRDIAEKKGKILTNDLADYKDDAIVYIPPGLKEYNLKKVKQMAYTYFYWQNTERIERLLNQGFVQLFEETLQEGPEIYFRVRRGESISIERLLSERCKG